MKVFRFGSKKRPDPRPEDEWLRKALLEAQREPVGIPSQDVTFALSGTLHAIQSDLEDLDDIE